MRGALWRRRAAVRQSIWEVGTLGALVRGKDPGRVMRNLEAMLRQIDRPRVNRRQGPEEQRAFFLDFARRNGLKVERHEHPVI